MSVESRAALLHYYFGRGHRTITIDTPPFRLAGRLATKWEGRRRRWWVKPAISPAISSRGNTAGPASLDGQESIGA